MHGLGVDARLFDIGGNVRVGSRKRVGGLVGKHSHRSREKEDGRGDFQKGNQKGDNN